MENQTETQLNEIVDSVKREGREKAAPDYPVIKIQLPKEAAIKVQSILQILKERKADTKADELLTDYLNAISEEYLEDQLEKRTPEDYYFEAAKNIPELREKIILQAKKALQRTDRSNTSSMASEPKRLKKKARLDEEDQTNSPSTELTQ